MAVQGAISTQGSAKSVTTDLFWPRMANYAASHVLIPSAHSVTSLRPFAKFVTKDSGSTLKMVTHASRATANSRTAMTVALTPRNAINAPQITFTTNKPTSVL